MSTMSNSIMNEMFPGEKIHKVDLHEGLSIGCIRYFLSFSHFTSKITYSTYIVYCTYNTMAFQGFQKIAGNVVPLCSVFYADKAGSTKNCTHHPIYGT